MPKVTRDEVGKAFEETQKLLDRLLNQFVCILTIGGTNDVANGKLASWDTLKKIEVSFFSE